MIFCARATRGLRRVGGEQPGHPSCSLRPHDQNVLPQCADYLAAPLRKNLKYGPERALVGRAQSRINQATPEKKITEIGER